MKDENKKTSMFKSFIRGALKTPEDDDIDEYEEKERAGSSDSYKDSYDYDSKSKNDYSSYYDFDDYSSSSKSSSTSSRSFASSDSSSSYSSSDTFGKYSDTSSSNIYNMSSKPKFRLSILRLERLEDAVKVADNILTGNTITLIDLRSVPRDIVRRIIDFIDGVRYTCDAKMEIVADYTYVVVPKDVELTGDLLSQIDTSNLM